jgi:hypothetical protein
MSFLLIIDELMSFTVYFIFAVFSILFPPSPQGGKEHTLRNQLAVLTRKHNKTPKDFADIVRIRLALKSFSGNKFNRDKRIPKFTPHSATENPRFNPTYLRSKAFY